MYYVLCIIINIPLYIFLCPETGSLEKEKREKKREKEKRRKKETNSGPSHAECRGLHQKSYPKNNCTITPTLFYISKYLPRVR